MVRDRGGCGKRRQQACQASQATLLESRPVHCPAEERANLGLLVKLQGLRTQGLLSNAGLVVHNLQEWALKFELAGQKPALLRIRVQPRWWWVAVSPGLAHNKDAMAVCFAPAGRQWRPQTLPETGERLASVSRSS